MRSVLRWLIRSLCLLALVAVLAAWVTSYFVGIKLDRAKAGQYMVVGTAQGYGYAEVVNKFPFGDEPLQYWVIRGATFEKWLPAETILGFYAGTSRGNPDTLLIICPLWLPTLVLLGLNAFLWRKAFRRTPRGAFPIEPTAAPK